MRLHRSSEANGHKNGRTHEASKAKASGSSGSDTEVPSALSSHALSLEASRSK